MTSVRKPGLVPAVMLWKPGFASVSHFGLGAQPVHLLGSPSLPRPLLTHNDTLWCRTFYLLAIAYDYNVLGLGPD
jgi:hypothetical protein